jgi:hypothetical protein
MGQQGVTMQGIREDCWVEIETEKNLKGQKGGQNQREVRQSQGTERG